MHTMQTMHMACLCQMLLHFRQLAPGLAICLCSVCQLLWQMTLCMCLL